MIKPLHGLRGLAALVVFFYHYLPILPGLGPEAFPGGRAVDVFFCLSGFVLTHVYYDSLIAPPLRWNKYTEFLRNRFARVVPLAWITTIVCISLIALSKTLGYEFKAPTELSLFQISGNLLFLDRTWMYFTTLLVPKWSVSNEVWAYILIFPLFHFFQMLRSTTAKLALGGMIILGQGIFYGWLDSRLGPFFARCVPEFMLGYFAYELVKLPWWGKISCTGVFIAGLAGFLLVPERFQGLVSLLIVVGAAQEYLAAPVSKFLSCQTCLWLGDISYSLYLWHTLVQYVAAPVRKGLPVVSHHYWFFFLGVVVPVTLAVSHFSYHFLERPLRDLLKNKRASRTSDGNIPLTSELAKS